MTYYGIDPVRLEGLGRTIEFRSESIAVAASRLMPPLQRHGREAVADRLATCLTSLARRLATVADDFAWRIRAVLEDDHSTAFAHSPFDLYVDRLTLATAAPPGVDMGAIAISRSELRNLSTLAPADVARFFSGQTRNEIAVIAAAHPELIGTLDGAPPWARYAANDVLIGRRISSLHTQAHAAREFLAADDVAGFIEDALHQHISDLRAEAGELQRWLAEDRQILLFDPMGDGRVVEVFGDLEQAVNIGITVPGITNDRFNFSDGDGGFRANARTVHERAAELGIDDVATIAWLGYNTPDGAGALVKAAAREGRDDLIDFVAGMDALPGRRHITVVGHSYGSLVTGMATARGLAANDVVFVGSPGTSLEHADQAVLKPGGQVWAGLAHGDPIGAGVDLSGLLTPHDQITRTLEQLLDTLGGEPALKDLHHGVNPAHEDFGAIEFHTDGATGHSEYYKPETVSLDNLLYIIAGMDRRVSIEMPDEIELAPGPFGEPWQPWAEGEVA